MQHEWIKSTLGHGETMCKRCFVTNREAAAIGMDSCDADPGEDLPLICPVTCQPCATEQDEFCEDYGCARKAGIDVDRDLIT